LLSYGDLMVLKMAAVRHLGFVKIEMLSASRIPKIKMRHSMEFRKVRQNRFRDTAI